MAVFLVLTSLRRSSTQARILSSCELVTAGWALAAACCATALGTWKIVAKTAARIRLRAGDLQLIGRDSNPWAKGILRNSAGKQLTLRELARKRRAQASKE